MVPSRASGLLARLTAPVLFASGAGLIAYAVAQGSASVALWAIVPVVRGRSAPFLLGTGLLFLGALLLPLSWTAGDLAPRPPTPAPPPEEPGRGGGGLLLVGPVPIFFGSWATAPRWVRWAVALAVVGAMAVLLAAVLLAG